MTRIHVQFVFVQAMTLEVLGGQSNFNQVLIEFTQETLIEYYLSVTE